MIGRVLLALTALALMALGAYLVAGQDYLVLLNR